MATDVGLPPGFEVQQDSLPPGFQVEQAPPQQQAPRQPSAMDVLNEFAGGAARGITGIADTFTVDPINALLHVMGSNKRAPTWTELLEGANLLTKKGAFAGPGAATDIASGAGEAIPGMVAGGGALRAAAGAVPAAAEGMAPALLRAAGGGTVGQDIGYGAAAGAGGAAGKDVAGDEGALVGSFLAPMSGAGAIGGIRSILNSKFATGNLFKSLSTLSEEGQAKMLGESLARANMSPEEFATKLQALGPDAIPADVDPAVFGRVLREASKEIPRIQGQATSALADRHLSQSSRLASALDETLGVPGLGVKDEIARMQELTKPTIDKLYGQARDHGQNILMAPTMTEALTGVTPEGGLPPAVRDLLSGDNSLGAAFKQGQKMVADRVAAGDAVTNFDKLDATKQAMDDQISKALRDGENNKARNLIRLKNTLVSKMDEAIPVYKSARMAFAGPAALEDAAELGGQILKMSPSDVAEAMAPLSEGEKRMVRLGLKQDILDRVDQMPVGSDAFQKLLGKNGMTSKLKSVFPDDQSLNEFVDAMNREGTFSQTRKAAQVSVGPGMPTGEDSKTAITAAMKVLRNPVESASAFGQIWRGLSASKTDQAYRNALEKTGDFLLAGGTKPEEAQAILTRGRPDEIRKALERVMIQSGETLPAMRAAATAEGQQ